MNVSKLKKSQAGFSLVELMVVVAIIGVLAAVAVPQINKYIAKARQSEAKTILSSIYTSEKAFYAEYTAYHSVFRAIGYSPEGKLRYNAGFSAAGTPATAANGFTLPAAQVGTLRNTVQYCGAAGVFSNGCAMLNGATGAAPPNLPATVLNSATSQFRAAAIANIYGSANDTWTIDHNKDLRNTVNGIN